jgi:Pyridoxamine 5'-phosphate oxidase
VARLKEHQQRFLEKNPYVGVVTTLRDDGSPHSTIVWVDVEDGKPSFNTAAGRRSRGISSTIRAHLCSSSIRTTRTGGSQSAVGRR